MARTKKEWSPETSAFLASAEKTPRSHAAGLAAARWGKNRPKSKPISIHIPAIEAMAAAGISDRPAWISALILKELEKGPRKGLPSRKP